MHLIPLLLLSSAVATLGAPSNTSGHPTHKRVAHSHQKRQGGPADLHFYTPFTTFETLGKGIQLHPNSDRPDDIQLAALQFLQTRLQSSPNDWMLGRQSSNHIAFTPTYTHIYFNQMIDGWASVNSVAHVVLDPQYHVISYAATFVQPTSVTPSTTTVTEDQAFAAAEQYFGNNVARIATSTQLGYYLTQNSEAIFVWNVQVRSDLGDYWYQAYVDARNGDIVGGVDFVSNAIYTVVPITRSDPRKGLELVLNAEYAQSRVSPQGWHNVRNKDTGATNGNNVVAFKRFPQQPQSQSSLGVYTFGYNSLADPTTLANAETAVTNAFYVSNMMHDIAYRYGFNERMFNFQRDNFNLGGIPGDQVLVSVQVDGSNRGASHTFASPPDGFPGQMNLYVDRSSDTPKDYAMSNDFIVHEYAHGITNRLTGGGTGLCLVTNEAAGMGEGWSDVLAFWTEQTEATPQDWTIGSYIQPGGVRSFPYSANKTVNPLTYSSAQNADVHAIGEVWANTLINVYHTFVGELGFSNNSINDASTSHGNVVFLQLLMDSLAIQPCNPNMMNSRDAWLQADVTRYGGKNACRIWRGFASRGFGLNAGWFGDDFTFPVECVVPTTTTQFPTPTPTTTSITTTSPTTTPTTITTSNTSTSTTVRNTDTTTSPISTSTKTTTSATTPTTSSTSLTTIRTSTSISTSGFTTPISTRTPTPTTTQQPTTTSKSSSTSTTTSLTRTTVTTQSTITRTTPTSSTTKTRTPTPTPTPTCDWWWC